MARPRSMFRLSLLANVVLAVSLLWVAHYAHSGSPADPSSVLDPASLRQIFLQALGRGGGSAQQALEPARTCSMCDVDPGLCEEFGKANIDRAIAFSGSNLRLRRALAKMRAGKPFTVAVIGGSVSRGHGLKTHNNEYAETNMNMIVFRHLNETFPSAHGSMNGEASDGLRNAFTNGAQPATGSDYFSMCFQEHIPTDVDLVLVELAINDEYQLQKAATYERLLRALLELPSQPAVLNLNIFALKFRVIADGGDLHNGFAQYMDVPIVSMRNVLLREVLADIDLIGEYFVRDKPGEKGTLDGLDTRHLNPHGHAVMGRLANAYIDTQMCEMDRIEAAARTTDIDKLYPIVPLPQQLLLDPHKPGSVMPRLSPQCFSTNSVKNPLVAKRSDGWNEWSWKDKNYIVSNTTGSVIEFDFETSFGLVQLFYLRSATFGLGNLVCWVDQDQSRAVFMDGYWDLNINIGRTMTIRDDLAPGPHVLHCELLDTTADPGGGHEFRLISLMSI